MNKAYRRSLNTLMEYFDLGPTVALTILLVSSFIVLTGVVFFVRSAPPTKITISAGPEGSIFHGIATKYEKALQKHGIKVNILTSKGSLDNLKRIYEKNTKIDLALVQGGSEEEGKKYKRLVSLGGISHQPIFFFYHGKKIARLAELKNKTIAIGQEGSGARKLSLNLLNLNGIKEGPHLKTMEGQAASEALLQRKIDGVFLMGEDASISILKKLLYADNVHLMSFNNANAYVRKIDYLHILEIPEGVLNFEKHIPAQNITLMGPMVELIATKDLHPALSDVILEAATDIHSSPNIFRKRGEFPMAIENRIKLSDDANRFYKSGKSFLSRYLPFWLASLVNRILIVFLPMLIILIPAVRSIPAIFRWSGHMRIRRRYRALLRLEEKFMHERDPSKLKELNEQFEKIEEDVKRMRVKAIFADQFYRLRSHIDYVRKLMASKMI